MFKWWRNLFEDKSNEVCDICGKRAFRSEAGTLIHYNVKGVYVHPEHILKSEQYKKFVNSPWSKKVSKTIKENGEYAMSHQEEAMVCRGGIIGSRTTEKKQDDGNGLLGLLLLGAMLDG